MDETPSTVPSQMAGTGIEYYRTFEVLKTSRKERLFHMRAQDITITEWQTQLSGNTYPGAPDLRSRGEFRDRLDHALFMRQATRLDLSFVEVEMELLLLRSMLVEERKTSLRPRCSACFDRNEGRSEVDRSQPVRPVRWDSLAAVDQALIPPPLRIVRTTADHQNQDPVANTSLEQPPTVDKAPPRHRSFKILVQRLKPQRSLKSSRSKYSLASSRKDGGATSSLEVDRLAALPYRTSATSESKLG